MQKIAIKNTGKRRNKKSLKRLLFGANNLISLSLMKQSKEKKDSLGEFILLENTETLVKVLGRSILNDIEAVISWR